VKGWSRILPGGRRIPPRRTIILTKGLDQPVDRGPVFVKALEFRLHVPNRGGGVGSGHGVYIITSTKGFDQWHSSLVTGSGRRDRKSPVSRALFGRDALRSFP
jgi:hypothetical protein